MTAKMLKDSFSDHMKKYPPECCSVEKTAIDKKYVHKKLDKNVAITRPSSVSKVEKLFRSQIIVAHQNDFFFDHDLRHLPGMLMIEASRQLGVAVTHIFYEIPLKDRFILNKISSRFFRLSNKVAPVYIDMLIKKELIKEKIIQFMKCECFIHQNKHLIGTVSGNWSTVTASVFAKLEENINRNAENAVYYFNKEKKNN